VVQPDGKAVLAGSAFINSAFNIAVARFLGGSVASEPPQLLITEAAPGTATVSCIPAKPGWVPQETLSLTPSNWTNAPTGATNPVLVPLGVQKKFYRLRLP
jgi:hypothetical protein